MNLEQLPSVMQSLLSLDKRPDSFQIKKQEGEDQKQGFNAKLSQVRPINGIKPLISMTQTLIEKGSMSGKEFLSELKFMQKLFLNDKPLNHKTLSMLKSLSVANVIAPENVKSEIEKIQSLLSAEVARYSNSL